MGIVPTKQLDFLQWCAAHQDTWTVEATNIGLTAAMVTAWKTKVDAAETAVINASAMRDAAKSATMTANDAVSAARSSTAELIRKIKDFALAGHPTAYALANIPAPADPSTIPPPGQPTNVGCDLDPNGQLTLRWKCVNPAGAQGTFYTVRRRLGDTGPFVILGGSGVKRFTDAAIPAGTARVTYLINGQRGNASGPASSEFTVNFGVSAGGGMSITSVSEGAGPAIKMAA